MKITRVGGKISRDSLPTGGQGNRGWLAPPGATCPGGKINWDTGTADEVVTAERSHDLKFDKGTIYIVYFHTHVHVHIEKMGNLTKSKLKLYICDHKLRSCAQFAPRGKCASGC